MLQELEHPSKNKFDIIVNNKTYTVFVYNSTMEGLQYVCNGPMFERLLIIPENDKWLLNGREETELSKAIGIEILKNIS